MRVNAVTDGRMAFGLGGAERIDTSAVVPGAVRTRGTRIVAVFERLFDLLADIGVDARERTESTPTGVIPDALVTLDRRDR